LPQNLENTIQFNCQRRIKHNNKEIKLENTI
jgi:hypothetical protein